MLQLKILWDKLVVVPHLRFLFLDELLWVCICIQLLKSKVIQLKKCELQIEDEVKRLETLKTSKLRDLVLKKKLELEDISARAHIVEGCNAEIESMLTALETGNSLIYSLNIVCFFFSLPAFDQIIFVWIFLVVLFNFYN